MTILYTVHPGGQYVNLENIIAIMKDVILKLLMI